MDKKNIDKLSQFGEKKFGTKYNDKDVTKKARPYSNNKGYNNSSSSSNIKSILSIMDIESMYSKEECFDISKKAEEVISKLQKDRKGKIELNTNQLRKVLSAVSNVANKIIHCNHEELEVSIANEIMFIKTKIVYQVGRNGHVMKDFVEKANLLRAIDKIEGKKSNFKKFHQYVEALVAYHKYLGGE